MDKQINTGLAIIIIVAIASIAGGAIYINTKTGTQTTPLEKISTPNNRQSTEKKIEKNNFSEQNMINDSNLKIANLNDWELSKESSLLTYPNKDTYSANICQKNNADFCINIKIYDSNKACLNQDQTRYDIGFIEDEMLLDCQKIAEEDSKNVARISHAGLDKDTLQLLQQGKFADYENDRVKMFCSETDSCPKIISSSKTVVSNQDGLEIIEKFYNHINKITTKNIRTIFFKNGILFEFQSRDMGIDDNSSMNNYRAVINSIEFKK